MMPNLNTVSVNILPTPLAYEVYVSVTVCDKSNCNLVLGPTSNSVLDWWNILIDFVCRVIHMCVCGGI